MHTQHDVYTFLKEAGVFFIATEDGDEPKVRPFSMVMEYGNRLCFATDRRKPVFRQIMKDPKIEICAFHEGRWLRYCGTIVNCTTPEAKKEAMNILPVLSQLYQPEDDIMQVFYLEHARADFCSMTGETETVSFE